MNWPKSASLPVWSRLFVVDSKGVHHLVLDGTISAEARLCVVYPG